MGKIGRGTTTMNVSVANRDWLARLIQVKGESYDDILTRIRLHGYRPAASQLQQQQAKKY